jgi:hypothetical protein
MIKDNIEDLFDNLVDKVLIVQNSSLIDQDLDLAVQLKDRLLKLSKHEENFRSKKFYFEAIFLDLFDRTSSHPRIKFELTKIKQETIMQKWKQARNSFWGFGDQEATWKFPEEGFDLDAYFSSNWFHPSIDSYPNEKKELETSKNSYKQSDITFFDYFKKRLAIYDVVEPTDHIKYYKGIIRKKYLDLLRKKMEVIL